MTYKQSINIQNFQLAEFESEGSFDFPVIQGYENTIEPCMFAGFGEKIADPQGYGCHFFLDDYRIQRVWNNPMRYIPMLRRYKFVLAPDFSLYIDYPKALCIYNKYRKNWCARFWQENGIAVIPSIRWMFEDSYQWCFDGEPKNSVVAVSTIGLCNEKSMMDMFINGYYQMLETLNPIQVLWFGKYILPEKNNNVLICQTTMFERIRMLRANHSKGRK